MNTLTSPARASFPRLLTQASPVPAIPSDTACLDLELESLLFDPSASPDLAPPTSAPSAPSAPSVASTASPPTPHPGFVIDDIAKATWAARKITQASARITDRQTLAKTYKERIDAWLASSSASDESTIEFLSNLLRPYIETELAGMGKRRTIRLFEVDVSLRKRPDRLEIWEESEALVYCEAHHPETVITTKALSKSDLKSLLASGLVIPGASLAPGMDDIVVKPHVE